MKVGDARSVRTPKNHAAFPFAGLAAEGNYEAMVLSCIDPRFPSLTLDYMKDRGMLGKYSQFVIAGAAIGVVAPAFNDWHKTFWDNLGASIELHKISKVIAINHRIVARRKLLTARLRSPIRNSKPKRIARRLPSFVIRRTNVSPGLAVETGLMGLDGKVEMFI
jgi:hypothetical protein